MNKVSITHISSPGLTNQDQSSWDELPNANATTIADNITFSNGVLMTHRNTNNSVFEYTLQEQKLSQYQDTLFNPILNNTVSLSFTFDRMIADTFPVWFMDA